MSAPTPLRLVAAALLALSLCACEKPAVLPTQDEDQSAQHASSRIDGAVVAVGKARGNVILFLYDTAHPPPPQGTAKPLSFVLLTRSQVFGDAASTSNGPFTAPFTFSRVKPGHYSIRGVIDSDECLGSTSTLCRPPDLIPWFDVTNEPNQHDVGGAAVDPLTRAFQDIVVTDVDKPVTNITVSFSDASPFPDRPVFSVGGTSLFDPAGMPKVLDLTATALPLAADYATLKVVNEQAPAFLVRYVDDNNDGVPDDANGDGKPDFWPKVIVRKLETTRSLDANQANLVDETGQEYERALPSASAPGPDGDAVVLAAGLLPQQAIYDALNDTNGKPRKDAAGGFVTVPFSALKLVLNPAALALDPTRPAAAPVLLKKVPAGRYAIIVINPTGQTWRVPNELQPATANLYGPDFHFPAIDSQGFFIEVRP